MILRILGNSKKFHARVICVAVWFLEGIVKINITMTLDSRGQLHQYIHETNCMYIQPGICMPVNMYMQIVSNHRKISNNSYTPFLRTPPFPAKDTNFCSLIYSYTYKWKYYSTVCTVKSQECKHSEMAFLTSRIACSFCSWCWSYS